MRSATSPLVINDQKVSTGRIIATADNESPDIFAPTDATVTGFSNVEIAGRYTMRRAPAIDLKIASPIKLPPAEPIAPHWLDMDEAALWDRITEGQLTVHRRGSTPLAHWVLKARSKSCGLLVANAMEQQPLVTSSHRMLVDHGPEVIEGLAILARAIGISNAALVVPRRRTDSYRNIAPPADKYNIAQIALSHKYPTESDTILTKVLTRLSVPPGMTPMDVRVAMIDPATCLAVYRWVACGQRLAGRIVTICGHETRPDGNYFLPFGARCLDIIKPRDRSVIHGGPMIGAKCNTNTVVIPATDAILAISPSPYAPSSPCIRCGWCTDHCPTRLNVASLNDDFELSLIEHARRSHVTACVGCGVCSYICPARLPLMQRVKELKLAVIHAVARDGRTE